MPTIPSKDRIVAEGAMDAAVAHVQEHLGQTDGGFASHYFCDPVWDEMVDTMEEYLKEERAWMADD